ncbi:hypothetical protein KXX14_009169 [Aspergillus fumigatus]|nr:hypothetical protein KXX14_009169 [Aspergillus fumigatus]
MSGRHTWGNVAVNHTIWVRAWTNRPSWAIWGRKSRWEFNTTWHSLIIIQSNRRVHHSWFKNVWKSGLTADLGVTNTMDAASGGRQLSYELHVGLPSHTLHSGLQIHGSQLVAAFYAADLSLILPRGPFALA